MWFGLGRNVVFIWFTFATRMGESSNCNPFLPVKVVAEAVFTLVEVSCMLLSGDAISNLLDVNGDEVDERSLFFNPSPNLSFRAASNISVLFDVASALLTVAKCGPMAVAGKTALSNCLLTRLPVGDARLL